jgi:PAS domain S-box-containing protein
MEMRLVVPRNTATNRVQAHVTEQGLFEPTRSHSGEYPAVGSTRAGTAVIAPPSRELRCSLDDEGRLALVDGAWPSVLGWQPEEIHGWYWEELVHPADHVRFAKCLRRLRAGQGRERDMDLRLAARTGGHRLTSWTFVSGSGVDGILGLGNDQINSAAPEHASTVLAARNVELAARLQALEDRYAAVVRFAATAAHQLSEPLVVAESSAILLSEELGEDLDPMLRGRLDAIGRGASRARRLMDSLLADAQTQGLPLELRPVELQSVVNATLATLELQIQERRTSFVVGPLPRALGEAQLLSIVLENLVSNAVKYGPRSGGRVEISARRHGDRVRVSVSSGGRPIPVEEAKRIFQPFHRVPSERRVPGIGLGLTICARLMERLDGAIGVEPHTEDGNTFWIELRPAA